MKKLLKLLFIFYIISCFVNITFAQNVNTDSSSTKLEALWYYTESPRSRESFFKHSEKIDILGSQVYFLSFNGAVSGEVKADILAESKKQNIKVMPLLANIVKTKNGEYFSQPIMNDFLENTENWQKVSKFLKEKAIKNNYYGYQLDLENINIKQKDNFIAFVEYLKKDFEKVNLKLSAAIVSKISDNPKDYKASYWNNWAAVYDYKKLGEILDFVSVMAYDQPQSPGPVATLDWSKKVMDYTITQISKEKVSFGIPTYSWVYRSEKLKNKKMHFKMVDYGLVNTWKAQEEKQKLIKLSADGYKKAYANYWTTGSGINEKYGNISWLSYNLNGKNYTIWYEDKASFDKKYNQIKDVGIKSFSAWVLGDEDPKIWESL